MESNNASVDFDNPAVRSQELRRILEHERTAALERVRDLREKQDEDVVPPPGDEVDAARSLADVETHASLIERAEDRLKAIDFAFNRLEQGLYGICAQCGEEISIERLRAVPFAVYCIDDQQKRDRSARPARDWMERPMVHTWDVPAEMEITSDDPRDKSSPGAEELAMEITDENEGPARTNGHSRRGRPRKRSEGERSE
jgi:DnaK suppressor protein